MKLITTIILLISTLTAGSAGAPHLEGDLSILWVVPFAGILLSIAIFPLVASDFWHHNFGKISHFGLLYLFYLLCSQSCKILYEVLHVGLLEYIPFIILLLALFTISGGSNWIFGRNPNYQYCNYTSRYSSSKLDGNYRGSYVAYQTSITSK